MFMFVLTGFANRSKPVTNRAADLNEEQFVNIYIISHVERDKFVKVYRPLARKENGICAWSRLVAMPIKRQ